MNLWQWYYYLQLTIYNVHMYIKIFYTLVISDTYEQLDALVACFPWCGGVTSGARCIPRSSRCKITLYIVVMLNFVRDNQCWVKKYLL